MMRVALWIPGLSLALATSALALEPIAVGVYLPLSGDLGAAGQSTWEGIKIAHKMCPKALGRPVDLKVADTRSEKAEAANAVFRLIEKYAVVAIIGEIASGNTIAGSFHAERRGIPMVTPTAPSHRLTQGKRYVFRMSPIDADHATLAADLAIHRLAAGTAAIVCDTSQESSVEMAAFFKREFIQSGGTVVCEVRCRMGDRDFTAQLNRIGRARPDIIYAPISYVECGLLARQAREMGLDTRMIAGEAVHVPELMDFGGKGVDNLLLITRFPPGMTGTEIGRKLRELYTSQMNRPLEAAQAMGAEAYLLILDAIRRADSAEPLNIREALSSTEDFEGVTAKITIKKDRCARRPLWVNRVKDGKLVEVPVEKMLRAYVPRTRSLSQGAIP